MFSNDTLKTSKLTDKTKYGFPLKDIDKNLNKILNKDWIVFGRRTCPFTRKAMALLDHEQEDYLFVDKENDMKEAYENLKDTLNHDTIPLIIREGKFLGGYTQLLEFFHKKDSEVSEWEKQSPKDQMAINYYKDVVEALRKRDLEF
ncbi:Glutaredoxin [Pseudoloma neurophilia]|uniref:Glutaredoxin n=1 Tax=Pseudoloma neurophilia TaxID=146866 RepID=A0A0R0M4C8_9MICR|nr:Glutaredoxin [Pseudoloma neurophilia]